ncbi:hypothetical protein [uncultured Pseudacidovorax sp.]|uniref:aggregation-promoting factor C-terminal-like domain-containing protein n=1 Tax=uncultured Pseudacidovorax sp. TaxID=679313 RepID=UPI001B239C2F|nr:hypothetical protein [uncultured Pseudacidovorax sp.]MBO9641687.1 hypothetical protein [Pseudacidovorax sp.]
MATKHTHVHRPKKKAQQEWSAKSPDVVGDQVRAALRQAMWRENIAPSDFDDLLWILTQESAGVVDARNSHSSARGLFQLLRAQYELNPHGEKSFGNAVEECQGGIHYIYGRYHSAKKAREFWQQHHWY